jgi:hypothetical protein
MNGILLREESESVRREAIRRGLAVEVGELSIPFERTLVVGPNASIPWRLVDAGFRFLDRWEAAAPLANGLLAESIGGESDRERTRAITRDLRVLVYAIDLLFLRQCDGAERFVETWRAESEFGDERLAFLRALYLVKPLMLALPRSWLAESMPVVPEPARKVGVMTKLIHVEIAPGRYVCCRPEEAEMYRERMRAVLDTRRVTSDAH